MGREGVEGERTRRTASDAVDLVRQRRAVEVRQRRRCALDVHTLVLMEDRTDVRRRPCETRFELVTLVRTLMRTRSSARKPTPRHRRCLSVGGTRSVVGHHGEEGGGGGGGRRKVRGIRRNAAGGTTCARHEGG